LVEVDRCRVLKGNFHRFRWLLPAPPKRADGTVADMPERGHYEKILFMESFVM
jgi:hypothetical protein